VSISPVLAQKVKMNIVQIRDKGIISVIIKSKRLSDGERLLITAVVTKTTANSIKGDNLNILLLSETSSRMKIIGKAIKGEQ
jgi:hypothetical protein